MKRFFPAAMLAAICGMSAAPCLVYSAPSEAVPFGVSRTPGRANMTAYRERHCTIRAALTLQTRCAVTAMAYDFVGEDLAAMNDNSTGALEKRLHKIIAKRFSRAKPVVVDLLTLYILLETTVPESDFAADCAKDIDPKGDWEDDKHQKFARIDAQFFIFPHTADKTRLILELLAATSDASASLISTIR